MKIGFKIIISAILLWALKVYEHNVTIYESQMATQQLNNDASYMVSRFFAEGTSDYATIIIFAILGMIWYGTLRNLIKRGVKKYYDANYK